MPQPTNLKNDLQEMLDDPSVPLATRKELMIELDKSNRAFKVYSQFLKFFAEWFEQLSPETFSRPLKVLEIGSGSGELVAEFATWAKNKNIPIECHLMDMDPDILAWAQDRLRQKGISVIIHPSGTTHLAQFQDKEFDLIYSLHVLHHIQPLENVREMFNQALRISSAVFMVDFNRRFWNLVVGYISNLVMGIDRRIMRDGIISLKRAHKASDIADICKKEAPATHWHFEMSSLRLMPYYIVKIWRR